MAAVMAEATGGNTQESTFGKSNGGDWSSFFVTQDTGAFTLVAAGEPEIVNTYSSDSKHYALPTYAYQRK